MLLAEMHRIRSLSKSWPIACKQSIADSLHLLLQRHFLADLYMRAWRCRVLILPQPEYPLYQVVYQLHGFALWNCRTFFGDWSCFQTDKEWSTIRFLQIRERAAAFSHKKIRAAKLHFFVGVWLIFLNGLKFLYFRYKFLCRLK